MSSEHTYIGIGGHVVAINPSNGEEVWRTKLTSTSYFVSIAINAPYLLAAAAGELYGIDPVDGRILWHNKMKGLGIGIVSFATSDESAAGASAATSASASAAVVTS